MRRLTEVLVIPLRDGVSYCARITRDGTHYYTSAACNEESALLEAGLVLRDLARGLKTKPRVPDAT